MLKAELSKINSDIDKLDAEIQRLKDKTDSKYDFNKKHLL